MTVTLNLPPEIEKAFLGEAQARGLSLGQFITQVIVSRTSSGLPGGTSAVTNPSSARLEFEQGVPVLRTGQPIGIAAVDETLEAIRRDRDLAAFGHFD